MKVPVRHPQASAPHDPGHRTASEQPGNAVGEELLNPPDDVLAAGADGAGRGAELLEGSGDSGSIAAETAEAFIESKRIGERIKFLRQRKQMGLVELGRHTGLSASFLSQLETGRVVPTLRNLARIAMVFSKDLSFFFEPERPELFRIVRAVDRPRMPQTGAEEPGYYFESLGHVPFERLVVPYVAEFLPHSDSRPQRPHRHPGAEFLYVLNGCLQLTHDGKTDTLETGDAVYFNTESAHSYGSASGEECTALILTMPEPLHGHHTGTRIPTLREPASRGADRGRSSATRN